MSDGDAIEKFLSQPLVEDVEDAETAEHEMLEGARLFHKGYLRAKSVAKALAAAGFITMTTSCVSVDSVSVGYNAQTGHSEFRVATRKASGKEVVSDPLPQAPIQTRSRILSYTAKRLLGLTTP